MKVMAIFPLDEDNRNRIENKFSTKWLHIYDDAVYFYDTKHEITLVDKELVANSEEFLISYNFEDIITPCFMKTEVCSPFDLDE